MASAIDAQELPLTAETLTASKLVMQVGLGFLTVEFKKDGKYGVSVMTEGGGWGDSGRYSINGNQVELKPEACTGSFEHADDCEHSLGHAFCRIVATPNSIYTTHQLTCQSEKNKNLMGEAVDSFSITFPQTKLPPDTKRIFHGIPVVTIGEVKARTTDAVKIRKAPSVNAESFEYHSNPFGPGTSTPFVPAGVEVIVVARSVHKEKVKNWENYWYLVTVNWGAQEVWMYGEFLAFKSGTK